MDVVKLTDADQDFIHLAREDQLDRIVGKYWDKVPEYVVLKIDTKSFLENWSLKLIQAEKTNITIFMMAQFH